MMMKMERLQKKGIMLFVLVLTLFLALMNYAYGDFFFTTNATTAYNWSAGVFYQTESDLEEVKCR